MSIATNEGKLYKNISASALVKTGQGKLQAIVVNSMSGGTIKLWDNTSAAAPVICNTITLAATDRVIDLKNVEFTTGLYVTIGGTADITLLYR
jgi:hypothetical protein